MAYARPSFAGEWEAADPPEPDAHPAPITSSRSVRMECTKCGSHVIVAAASRLGGQCTNCASYELRPLTYEEQLSDAAVHPEQHADEPAPW